MNPIPRYEVGDTRQFIATYSAAPGGVLLSIATGSGAGSLVASALCTASTSLIFAGAYTMPASTGLYAWTLTASFALGPVVQRGWFQVIKTIPG